MWNLKNSLTSKDFIDRMNKPNFIERLFEEHKRILEIKVPSKFKAYAFAGPENRLLFKSNRVDLPGPGSAVINASYIKGDKQPNAYIATETPQSAEEAEAFWKTVSKHETNIVVLLNKPGEHETGYLYWHPHVGKSVRFGRLTVGTIKSWMAQPTLKITKLVVTDEKRDSLSVYHFSYSDWQNRDILPPVDDFMKMLLKVRKYRENTMSFKGCHGIRLHPILVHCSNGLDRTMVYCAIDISISKYFRTEKVNVFSTVSKLRQQRYKCLPDTHHYYFCYSALYEYFLNKSLL